ncbi:hypothetical protein AB4307_17395 [Vibrio sp. 10N.261.52.C2]|uniref:hypothetical protein n=1 Tax=unclassified Vibrio TaxID=2614977 RepID=UPI00355277B1
MIKNFASSEYTSVIELKNDFQQLIGSRFFLGPLSEEEAQKEFERCKTPFTDATTNIDGNVVTQCYKNVNPMLIFICEEQYFIVYP